MFDKVLVANRGEIAVRIIRALKEMNIKTVAIYSTADKNALHTKLADEAICIGPARSKDSYLNMQSIISAAYITKSQAIHPGFGFLSENAIFANLCEECNITFIGPRAETIDILSNKINARKIMKEANIATIQGSKSEVKNIDEAKKIAENYKYPIMIKAIVGGGGKGIKVVYKADELESAFNLAKSEAKASFNNDSVYIEKLIENARHIEVQILADNNSNIIHLYERDCSIQRRNQKLIEEAPASHLDDDKRKEICKAAIKVAKAVNYLNAGTVEFLYDKNGEFYFMEMNTRIQVEHPITEMITSIDIVKEQIKIAAGQNLSLKQGDVKISGHSIECRINAEDCDNNFMPSTGKIDNIIFPQGLLGLRVDSAIYPKYIISQYYDSMIAKVITHADTRNEAISKMKRALSEFKIEGIKSNIDFHLEILNNKNFIKANYDTSFVEKILGGE